MTRMIRTLTNTACRSARGICMILALTLAMHTTPAHADNTFLLQLENTDSEALAKEKWADIKSKNTDVLGTLNMRITQVALPPDNKVSYRIQVGPVASKEQAETLCNTLQSRDVECYVVETAMFASEASPESIAEVSPPPTQDIDTTPQPKETKAEMKEAAEADETPAPRKKAAPSEEDNAHSDDPDYIPPPVDSGPVVISTSQSSTPAITASAPAEVVEAPQHAAPQAIAEATPAPVPAPAATHYEPAHVLNTPAPMHDVTVISAPVAPAPAAAQADERPGFFARLFGASSPKPATAQNVVGSVNVGEAVRVPLSTDQPSRTRIIPVLPQVHPLGGAPSESTAKTFWAQISYFRDEAQALTFFRKFSASYPQFTDGVRIRITRPFLSTMVANRVSLRVGPFAGTGDVQTICAVANRWQARCTIVRDIGASTAMGVAPQRAPATGQPAEGNGPYWLQFGTFHSEEEAWDVWKTIRKEHRSLVRHLRPTVTTPAASSAAGDLFRLRAGPLKTAARASTACDRLESVGTDCIVVNDR